MKKNNWQAIVMVGCLAALLSGCGTKAQESNQSVAAPDKTVTCIGVLPVKSIVDYGGSLNYEEAKALRRGVEAMDDLLRQEFGNNADMRFPANDFFLGLDQSEVEKPLAMIRLAGKSLSCNLVLETTLLRYAERVGGNYSIESPASVSFKYRLVNVDDGAVICRGQFDETQKSIMENLLGLNRAMARGFVWITADELLREGIRERLGECSLLSSN